MSSQNWNADNIPSQTGKTILITGANSGLGLEAAKVLSGKGAHVIMTARNMASGKEAVSKIKKENPNARLDLMRLDLSDFASIHQFSEEFHKKYSKLDIYIQNAGVMTPVNHELTREGFELQFGTNHLGHFLLTGLLLDIVKNTPNARIAIQSSLIHKLKTGKPDIHFDDLNFDKGYNKQIAYAQSKLANLLFAYELDRKLKAHNINATVAAAHPGYTKTNLARHTGFFIQVIFANILAQKVEIGTLPILRAAADSNVKGGEYFGPTKMREMRGYPELVRSSDKSYDRDLARRLWEVSEELTGVTYNFS
ncbi:NAD(P)-dependent dehydrogenase (short-subunit alcohol dehydrogenase family) [Chitinophaga dinghuensis]|uniref:NAD(P)-dependent dehydrogenase (Short-subunit alcohol dehydrogenase family) n=1 Tax=Chitinophaga dinghuensis TaxID=1539050 RepID=A0A327VT58_9BACT|nr:oxidoreductase [Chitinophaga dinghuensis]RAJ77594.1 NAD(P)-dependent dehydrogenase (short-subunit alcohol dehydrogenase family) [Chitinophaga dinghuensis]